VADEKELGVAFYSIINQFLSGAGLSRLSGKRGR